MLVALLALGAWFTGNAQINMTTNGYVMVGGTSTPITPLHVNGDVFIPYSQSFWLGSTSTSSNRLRLSHSGTSGDAYMDYVPNLHLRAGTTDAMYLSSTGNVGIGTTTPVTPLDINGDVHIPYGQSYWIGSSTSANNRLRLYHSGTSGDAYMDYVPNLHFRSNATDVMYLSSTGKVGIGTSTPLTPLHVNGDVYLPGTTGSGTSYWINATASTNTTNIQRLRLCVNTNTYTAAYIDFNPFLQFRGSNYNTSGAFTGFTYPLYLNGSNAFVGINTQTPQYQLDVNGIVRATNVSITSDARLKEKIKNLKNPKDSLFLLQGVSYNLKKPIQKTASTTNSNLSNNAADTVGKGVANIFVDSALYSHRHVGFIAQDVQKIFPDLVYTDKNGMLSVDYIAIIPMLVEAMKQQQQIINTQATNISSQQTDITNLQQTVSDLQTSISSCCKSSSKTKDYVESDATTTTSYTNTSATQQILLYQNAPNPFKIATTIKMYIPQSVGTAMICIYDLNGRQLECLPVGGRGTTSVDVSGSMLTAGMYYYSLLADGNLVDTKKMILTE